ncbi:hypothetical protein [Aeromonas enteropelogenes]|uniref:hypothetical protein n=1 Tax=Aeromonas enteropelogenes TaxID=29489 RepID=UPI003F7466EE
MTQPILHTTPTQSAALPLNASRLDDHIARFEEERAKLAALDDEVMTLRQHRKQLQEQVAASRVRLEELRQGRINQLIGGATSLESAREYRELGELVADAKEALAMSQRQEKRLALPLYQTLQAVNNAQSIIAGCYESYLDHRVAPTIQNTLKQHLAGLAALTHAKAAIMGPDGARKWALNELGHALKGAMSGTTTAPEGDHPAARSALGMLTRPRASDLLALCNSPGKRQVLLNELKE